jgi:uncharacterized protein (DUF1919 family)
LSYVASNCVGGRFSELQGTAYASPTVGLFFEPSDFMAFCEDLPRYLGKEVRHDLEKSQALGYPVGDLDGLKVMFQHFASFDDAKAKWEKRTQRVELNNVVIIFGTCDGFTQEHVRRFDALPMKRKILFTHVPLPGSPNAIYVPGFEKEARVGDLYSDFYRLGQSRVSKSILRILHSDEGSKPSEKLAQRERSAV